MLLENSLKKFKEIDQYCKKLKIDWFVSCWDNDSVMFMKKFKVKYHKVASAMITNKKLLIEIAKQRKLTFISTGMSTYKDINAAISIFKKHFTAKITLILMIKKMPQTFLDVEK